MCILCTTFDVDFFSPKCSGPLYCWPGCRLADTISHLLWCAPMEQHIAEADELAAFPFSFAAGSAHVCVQRRLCIYKPHL